MSLKRPVVQPVDNLICSLDHKYCKRRCPDKDNIHYSAASLTSLYQHPGVNDSSCIGTVPIWSPMENIHCNGEGVSLAELVTTPSVEVSDCNVHNIEGGSSSESSVPPPTLTSVPITTTVASTTSPTTPGTNAAATSSAFFYFGNRRNIHRATDGL